MAHPSKVLSLIEREEVRQRTTLNLIASENYASDAVRKAQGSVLTNKYAEGYPGKRYYSGCQVIDEIERYAQQLAQQIFGAEHVNVQPHSGSNANMAVYMAVLNAGDTILGMELASGGHLTHGAKISFSGKFFNSVAYHVNPKTHLIDYDEVQMLALLHQPKLIIAGASAYSQPIDYPKFAEIAQQCGAYLMVDIAHVAGLIAAGLHANPVPYAHFVTSTTHKTLRGPRGGLIMCKKEFANLIDRAVMPGIQGGPLMHVIAAKAVAFEEALQPQFIAYQKLVIQNAQILCQLLADLGYAIVSHGTTNHLFTIDLRPVSINGKQAAVALERAGIIVNANMIPHDTTSPLNPSGIRIGTPAITTRGTKPGDMPLVAHWIVMVLKNMTDELVLEKVKSEVEAFCSMSER